VPPVVVSLNRGLWVALFVAAAFGMGHAIRTGRAGIAVAGSALAIAGAVVFILSPLFPVVTDRLRNPASNAPRSYIYAAAFDGARASPLLGWGGPRRAAGSPRSIAAARSIACPDCGLSSIGTHGTFWLIAFSHGFVALALFYGFFGSALRRLLRRRSDLHAACALVVILFVLETGFYDQLPTSLVIVMAALGIAWRSSAPETAPSPALP
jgi:O-antigen ligase